MNPLIPLLVVMGVAWGATQSLSKIALQGGYTPLPLIFWQVLIAVLVLGAVRLMRGHNPLAGRDWGLGQWRVYLMIAAVGTLIPQYASYSALAVLPAGLIAILIALVPMFAFPIALALGVEDFKPRRLIGLSFGALGVVLIVGPEASLPEAAMVAFVPLALVAPLFYGMEGNLVARFGLAGLDPVQALFGASLVGGAVVAPLMAIGGDWAVPTQPFSSPADAAMLASSLIHAVVYTAYVWMVGRAGSIFAAQVSYVVTGSGVIWAMLLLGESFSGYLWAALAIMMVGLFFVQPRPWKHPAGGQEPPREDVPLADDPAARKNVG